MRIWLVASVSVMALAVLISASRSGLIGLMSAMFVGAAAVTAYGARPPLTVVDNFTAVWNLLITIALYFVIFGNLISDVLYAVVDPRIRNE